MAIFFPDIEFLSARRKGWRGIEESHYERDLNKWSEAGQILAR
jgi:hypothetical protein